jgi:hypothetical protein
VYQDFTKNDLDNFNDFKGRSVNHYDISLENKLYDMIKMGYNKLDIISSSLNKLNPKFYPNAITEEEIYLAENFMMRKKIQNLDPKRKHFRFFGFCLKTDNINHQTYFEMRKSGNSSRSTLNKFKKKLLFPTSKMAYITAQEHYDVTLQDIIDKIRKQNGEFKPKNKFILFLELLKSLKLIQTYYSHCNINPDSILFKFLNKNKVKRYKEKQNVIIKANDFKYSMKLGGFQHLREFGQNCFNDKSEDELILTQNPNNNVLHFKELSEALKEVKQKEKQYPGKVPTEAIDNKYYYVRDSKRKGEIANPKLNLSLNKNIILTDTWNLGWTFFEIESEQWLGYSVLKIIKFVGEELEKGRKMKDIFENDLYEEEGTLVAEMLNEIAQDDRNLLTNIITVMMKNNIEEDNDIDVDDFLYKYYLSDDDQLAVYSFILSIRMFISTTAKKYTIHNLNSNLEDFAVNASDKRRQIIFSVMMATNEEIAAKMKDAISNDIFEIVLRKMYLPIYLKDYFEFIDQLTSIKVEFRPSLEKLIKLMTNNINSLKRIKNMVIKKIYELNYDTIANMDITLENVTKLMTQKRPKFLI